MSRDDLLLLLQPDGEEEEARKEEQAEETRKAVEAGHCSVLDLQGSAYPLQELHAADFPHSLLLMALPLHLKLSHPEAEQVRRIYAVKGAKCGIGHTIYLDLRSRLWKSGLIRGGSDGLSWPSRRA